MFYCTPQCAFTGAIGNYAQNAKELPPLTSVQGTFDLVSAPEPSATLFAGAGIAGLLGLREAEMEPRNPVIAGKRSSATNRWYNHEVCP